MEYTIQQAQRQDALHQAVNLAINLHIEVEATEIIKKAEEFYKFLERETEDNTGS